MKRALHHAFSAFNTAVCNNHFLALAFQELLDLPCYPAATYPDPVSQRALSVFEKPSQTKQEEQMIRRLCCHSWGVF